MCEFIVNGLHSTHKIPFLLLFLIRAVYANEPEEEIAEILFTLSEFIQNFEQMDLKESEERVRFSSRLATFLVALKQKDSESLPIFPAILSFIDVELRKKDINIDLTKLLKRIYIEFDVRKPMLIVESGALDTWWLLAKLTLKHIRKKPQLLVMGKHLDDDEINMNLNNCKLSGRWIILQGLHNQIDNLYRIISLHVSYLFQAGYFSSILILFSSLAILTSKRFLMKIISYIDSFFFKKNIKLFL